MNAVNAETLARLARIDTATICNVIEMFDVRPRNVEYTGPQIVAQFPELPVMLGYATTAVYRSSQPDSTANPYAMLTDQLAAIQTVPGPRVLFIQDLDEPLAGACIGGIMATMYKSAGCVGVVTNGAGRDVDEIRELDLNFYSTGRICSRAYFHLLDFNVPVTVGGLTVEPGDLVHGDGDGVTKIPPQLVAQLPEICEEYLAIEKELADAIKSGGVERVDEAFAASRVRFQELAARIETPS